MFNRSFMAGITQTLPVPPPVDVRTMLYNTYLAILNAGSGGLPEIFTVQTVADLNLSLNGKFFVAYDENGSVAIQMKNTTPPFPSPPVGYGRVVTALYSVGGFPIGATAAQIASVLNSALVSDSAFTPSVVGNTVTITNKTVGPRTDSADVDTGFTITTTQQGTL